MTTYDTRTYPTISPYLYYEDGAAALEWLPTAFGLTERMRSAADDGTVVHAELELGDAVVMLGCPPGHRSPKRSGERQFGIYVHVDDVDAHHARAVAAGAEVDGKPAGQSYGVRSYGALDLEGNQWWFAQPLG